MSVRSSIYTLLSVIILNCAVHSSAPLLPEGVSHPCVLVENYLPPISFPSDVSDDFWETTHYRIYSMKKLPGMTIPFCFFSPPVFEVKTLDKYFEDYFENPIQEKEIRDYDPAVTYDSYKKLIYEGELVILNNPTIQLMSSVLNKKTIFPEESEPDLDILLCGESLILGRNITSLSQKSGFAVLKMNDKMTIIPITSIKGDVNSLYAP
ncbi:MAG: hypothetical protein LBI26_03700 [Holosporales bacterium]|jgi:hypothetical protein|nr:hypothetical protein [Holosporales bacterium]